ncbi:stalk domain-containing protein [Paenibacillus thiaminolyticus]|uniref:stalk domain-containing protein n=1 Tax=Paenibacillus thiaminolyticus TaxID=49283 RepID=UPI003D2B52DF
MYVNGKFIGPRYPSLIQTNTVLLPVSTVASALGTKLQFNPDPSVAMPYSISYNNRTMSFGSEQQRIMYDDGFINRKKPLADAVGATLVPYPLFENGLGPQVIWKSELQQLHIDEETSD